MQVRRVGPRGAAGHGRDAAAALALYRAGGPPAGGRPRRRAGGLHGAVRRGRATSSGSPRRWSPGRCARPPRTLRRCEVPTTLRRRRPRGRRPALGHDPRGGGRHAHRHRVRGRRSAGSRRGSPTAPGCPTGSPSPGSTRRGPGSRPARSGWPARSPASTRPARPGGWRLIGRTDPGPVGRGPRHPAPAGARDPGAVRGRVRALTVVDAGPLTTVQDPGRPGWAHLGVPRSGALDRPAADLANRLVGNDAAAAVLEVTLGGVTLTAARTLTVAVTGAPLRGRRSVRGRGRSPSRPAAAQGQTLARRAGPARGRASYVAVAGGIAVPPVLGLPVDRHPRRRRARRRCAPATCCRSGPAAARRAAPTWGTSAACPGPALLRVYAGPRADWFDADVARRR